MELTKAWSTATAALPLGWEIRGLTRRPRRSELPFFGPLWVAWARPSPDAELPDPRAAAEGGGETPEQALTALAVRLQELRGAP